jgi:hypothetical protein
LNASGNINEFLSNLNIRMSPSIHIFRPLSGRYNEGGIHRRSYNLYDRGSKTSRGITHRTSRSTINQKQTSSQKTDEET